MVDVEIISKQLHRRRIEEKKIKSVPLGVTGGAVCLVSAHNGSQTGQMDWEQYYKKLGKWHSSMSTWKRMVHRAFMSTSPPALQKLSFRIRIAKMFFFFFLRRFLSFF